MAGKSLTLSMRVFHDDLLSLTEEAIEFDTRAVVRRLLTESQLNKHLQCIHFKLQNAAKRPYDVSTNIEIVVDTIANRTWWPLWLTEVAVLLSTNSLPFWLSSQDTVIYRSSLRTGLHPDIPVEEFSLGSFLHPNRFHSYYSSKTTGNLQISVIRRCKARFEYDSNRLYVFFEYDDRVGRLELLWNRDIAPDVIVVGNGDSFDIYFLLLLPPRVGIASPLKLGRKTVSPNIDNIDGEEYQFNPTRVSEFLSCSGEILGGSTCLRLRISASNPGGRVRGVSDILSRLQSLNFRVNFTNVIVQNEQKTKDQHMDKCLETYLGTFGERWAFKVLLTKGLVVSEMITQDISCLKELALHSQRDPDRLVESLYLIADLLETRRFVNLKQALKFFMSDEYKRTLITLPNLKKVRRVVATPTRCIFYPPHIMFENRVLREYDAEFCLRVSFRDDDMQKLSNVRAEEVFFRRTIQSRLEDGIHLSDRHFQFLACSNSQLRDHGVWFYAKDDKGHTAEEIREWMGDLHRIDCVATYVSRMGQCFSTSEDSIPVKVDGDKVKTDEEDVERNGYTFSDGTGRISSSLAQKVSKETGRKRVHSVYQIRYGGCKGTVSLDPTLEGDSLIIRKSMKKFTSDHQRLEVVKASQPCPLYLNHQAVMLMDQLGVSKSVFLRLQEEMLRELVDMFIYEPKAADALGKRTATGIKYRKLVESGIQLTFDPLFRQMLHAVMGMHMRDIRDRARIEIPSTHARNMFGAMDETITLQYNEVFVQYSKNLRDPGDSREVLVGDVIVTKFPALHQGDIRRFRAVDVPQLHHMVDCIVFPATGPRPHPNEMAGSDLDGDEYFVTWLPEFLNDFPKNNERPMDYPAATKNRLHREVKLQDIIQFVNEYIQNDRLGLISNAHKAHADLNDTGIFSDICQTLARKHSEAVDFPKTGTCPKIDEDERPKLYPDFMGKQGQSTVYRSNRALGELYRVCRTIGNLLPVGDGEGSTYSNVPLNENLKHKGYLAFLSAARETYAHYGNTIWELMERYGITSEAEVVSGCIRNLHLRISQRDEKFETIQLVKLQMQEVCKQFRLMFFQEFGGEQKSDTKNPPEKVMAKASAWYMASYDTDDRRAMSFPWIVWDVLRHVSLANMPPCAQDLKPSISKITTAIHDRYREMRKHSSDTCIQQFRFQSERDRLIPMYLYQNPGLIPLIQFLLRWAENEQVATRKQTHMLTFQDFALLLLQFATSKEFISHSLQVESWRDMQNAIVTMETTMSAKLFEDVQGSTKKVQLGEILIEFLNFLSSQSLKEQESYRVFGKSFSVGYLSFKAFRAYYCLAVTADIQQVMGGSLETKPVELTLVIPHELWQKIRNYGPSIESALRELFGDSLSEITLRAARGGKYPQGRLWAVGYNSTSMKIEDLFNAFRTNMKSVEFVGLRKKEDYLLYCRDALKIMPFY